MSKLQSHEEKFVENKIARLEQELIQLKAKQPFGMNNVQLFTSNAIKESSHTYSYKDDYTGYTGIASSTDILKIRFTGNKPSKTVIGMLNWKFDVSSMGSEAPQIRYLHSWRGDKPNILEWLVFAWGGWDVTDPIGTFYKTIFDVTFTATTNEIGKLSIEQRYDASSYAMWMLG